LFKRRTFADVCQQTGLSRPTVSKHFDALTWPEGLLAPAPADAINLLIDATFFGRAYGYLCFHDTRRIIWFREIKTEGVQALRGGLRELRDAGYRIKSVTIDGKRGYTRVVREWLGAVPIQMCLYHQTAIVRRYITDRPKSRCGQELKALMKSLCSMTQSDFINAFYLLMQRHRAFLDERNFERAYRHAKLRAAFRSLRDNLHQIFTYKDLPDLSIPPTINHLEGCFAHLKERIILHRGLSCPRKKNAAKAFFNSHPFF
jgi:hypothetical protein